MKKQIINISALIAITTMTSQAAVILATNFDVTTKSSGSQDMTDVVWTGDANVTGNTTISTVASNNDGYFTTGFGATAFAPDQNIENEGPWTATIQFTIDPGFKVTFSDITFDHQMLTNNGVGQDAQDYPRGAKLDVTLDGSAYGAQIVLPDTPASNSGTNTFTESRTLGAGTYSLTIKADRNTSTAGNNLGIDNLSLNGTVTAVPEPSSAALLGLGGLALILRRRK